MTPPDLIWCGPSAAEMPSTMVLAHGAGAPMDSPFMAYFADALGSHGIRVGRFEFPYMAKTRADGKKRPPDRAPVLVQAWHDVIEALAPVRPIIGGKSLGGRIASMVADDAAVAGLVCLGYPFHPPGKPETARIDHLGRLHTPTLIVQGTRDSFGSQDRVAEYALSDAIRLHWVADGDHGFKPRARSGHTEQGCWADAVGAIVGFVAALPRP